MIPTLLPAVVPVATTSLGTGMNPQIRVPGLAMLLLAGGIGTTAAYAAPRVPVQLGQTTSGYVLAPAFSAGTAISELRRVSGLSWDQLARLFEVSRRSLHFWASGRVMSPQNEERLQRVLGVVRTVARDSAAATRTALLSPSKSGALPFDLLAQGNYAEVVALLGSPRPRTARHRPPSREARRPSASLRPGELVDALQDRIHPASGRLLGSKGIRLRGK